tara:strand:- start:61735 stop:63204 length:1470 start_codon:yes stop_codon:yes gene_type:complete
MKKTLLILSLLLTAYSFSQVQIGSDIDGEVADDLSGSSVSISNDGNIVAIGANSNDGNGNLSGHVRVYKNIGGVWTQIGSDINGEAELNYSGSSVSLSSDGSIVAIGANSNEGSGGQSGHVRVYENTGGVWTQVGSDIDGEASGDFSGDSISLSSDGSIIAIGAKNNDGNGINSGHVRVYQNISGVWTQIGSDINGEAVRDSSGYSVSLSSDGNIVAIGGPGNDGNGNLSGHVRIYQNIGGIWTQVGSDINGEAIGDNFGSVVSLSSDGNIVAIGGITNLGNFSGVVRLYRNISGVWTKIGTDINGEGTQDGLLGISVSLSGDGNIVAIGARLNDGNGSNSGHVRVYRNISEVWTQVGIDINGEAVGDNLGNSLSLSSDGNIVAIGAEFNDGNGFESGHVRVFDLSGVLSSEQFVLENTSMYPNPTNKEFTVRLSENIQFKKLRIYDSLGKYIIESDKKEVNIEKLSKGLYFVEITTDQGKATKKLIVN